ncbi:MAG: SRPBCC domain-containing protein [Vicinamibacterales bacterium]
MTDPPIGRPPFSSHGVTLTRRFPDDPGTLFRAFTDAAALRQWWGPRDFLIEAIDFPAVVGATYRVTLRAPDGSRWAHEGRFLEVDPPGRLAYTWRWVEGPLSRAETLVELGFASVPGGTLVTVSHSRFESDAECEAHLVGWTDTFARVDAWLRP